MIFLALGTQKFQLNRLLRQMDEHLENQKIEWTEEIFAQTGFADYAPRHFPHQDFLDRGEYDKKLRECDLLVAHSGVGTLVDGLSKGKRILAFPRLKKYQECVDDHQLSIANAFSKSNYLLVCGENDNLWEKIEECRAHEFSPYVSSRKNIIQVIEEYLKTI